MFEPVHGSAPALAGKNVANPMGAILSVALMLEYLGLENEAVAVEHAVQEAVAASQRSIDDTNATTRADVAAQIGRRSLQSRVENEVIDAVLVRNEERAGHDGSIGFGTRRGVVEPKG